MPARDPEGSPRGARLVAAETRADCARLHGVRANPAPYAHFGLVERGGLGQGERVQESPKVAVIMGSRSDLDVLAPAIELLTELAIPHEVRIVSAHRTPDWMFEFAEGAEARGLEVIIAAAGGAAHLPGMVAAKTLVPVLGVPVPATGLVGVDSLLSIVQMPRGVPVGTLAIGKPGAANAALLAAQIVANKAPEVRERLRAWRNARRDEVLAHREV